VQPQYVFDIEF